MADVQHSTLSGADLHEPKGVEIAALGSVYVANGGGSGSWVNKNSDNKLFNTYTLQSTIADIGTANDKCYFFIEKASSLTRLTSITYSSFTDNSILSIYINGVLFADDLTCVAAGSSAGGDDTVVVTTPNSIPALSVVEVRSDGGTSTVAKAEIFLSLTAT